MSDRACNRGPTSDFTSKIPGIIVVSSGMTFTFSSQVNLARVD